MRKDWEKH